MKKYIFKIQAICASLMLMTSCNDFLDEPVLGNSTEENYYNTQYMLQSALNATYDILQSDAYFDQEWRFGEACGDDVVVHDTGLSGHMGQLVNFRFDTNNNHIKNRWTIMYKGIHRANQVIANAHRVQIKDTEYATYTNVRQILAQAKFLRAFFYFNLVKTFGGVPIRPEVETVGNLVVPRSSLEDCYAYIEKDLREAAIMLPPRFVDGNSGKAGAGAAVALLMKVLMYQAEPGVPSEKWEQMKQLGDFFVKGIPMTYGEMLRYDELYDEEWEDLRVRLWFKPQELITGAEVLETPEMELNTLLNAYSFEYKDANGMPIDYLDQYYIAGEFCQGSVFEIVFKESGDGTNGDTNEGCYIYEELFPASANASHMHSIPAIQESIFGNDPRRQWMVGHQASIPVDGGYTQIGAGRLQTLKWYTPMNDRSTYGGDNAKNHRVIRYVEVVYMYAEALNECGQSIEAINQLNSYKTVVNNFYGTSGLYVAGGYGYVRDQIWQERRIELCYEFDRFFDIVRQGRAKELLAAYAEAKYNGTRGVYFRQGINEIFPIPQNEIDVSNGVVTQNPGY